MSRNTLKNYWAESRLFYTRVIIAIIFMCILLAFLGWRLWQLQVLDRDMYVTLSNENHLDLIPQDPNRGLIYDRNGVLLAENVPVLSLDVIPNRVPDFKKSIAELNKLIPISDEELKQYRKALRQRRTSEGVSLKLNLTEEEAAKFYVNQYQFPGFNITGRLMRHYQHGESIVSVLGYVGRINEEELNKIDQSNYAASKYIGKLGVEKYYEDRLHGRVGYQQVETDAGGRVVRTLNNIAPVSGDDLYITIDIGLQEAAEAALGDEQGSVVAIDPKTGEVLAFVSNPRYDPNLFVAGISQTDYSKLRDDPNRPLYNRALRGLYPPGSTLKPFLAAEVLDTGITTPSFTIYDNGFFYLPGITRPWRDWNWDKGGHGRVNLRKAIVESCDVYFYTMSIKMGISRMLTILNGFGFGEKTGLDVSEELGGVIPSPDWKRKALKQGWFPGDTVNASIGQGYMLVTPLQLAHAAAVMANRGVGYYPRFALRWHKITGEVEPVHPLPKPPLVLKNATWDYVISAMQGVTEDPRGTARRMHEGTPYSIAAKTGTAQVYRPESYGFKDSDSIPTKYRSHSWLISFAPVEDPKIAVAVLVEHHPGQAAAVAKAVMDYYLLPNHGIVEQAPLTPQNGVQINEDGNVLMEHPSLIKKIQNAVQQNMQETD